ncbi:cysteine desulfurase family protein [Bdellovibrio sp. 22V]|uniref:cysteine desulfurase family protein n=1 Tax=Bdellovibrio sp. 22V TaxID=3044166 RepID=UPI002542D7C7|nr:cysteine desulfurase family protein [Bdellovibrio sp. 22V]WII70967.1 cysteine desulfurase family protein [Bdellovibrio sp. 22V]
MIQTKAFCYFDHNATTPVCKEVLEALPELAQAWGNPSSIHWGGRQPKNILREARKAVADAVGASTLEIVFTSGGSEANNTVIKGLFDYYQTAQFLTPEQRRRTHYMCSAVEHPAVIKAMEHLKSLGARVDFIPVNRRGEIDMAFYESHLSEETALVSVMFANNETGTLFPIKQMAEIAHKKGALFHTDAVQAFGKVPVNLHELGVDFASFSGHKFYSVKGSGFLYSRKGSNFSSLINGGGQERHRRGGTENTLGIGALGVVAKRVALIPEKAEQMAKLRDHMEARILSEIEEVTITAGESPRLPNTSSLVLKGVDGETMLMSLDIKGYAVSTGAACSSGNPEPSPVLLAMGLTREEAQNSLRVSIGWETTLEQVNAFVEALKVVVARLRSLQNDEGDSCHV